MNATKIEWAKNPDGTPGYTWNPITGCLNGCEYCYARKLANTRLKERYLANYNIALELDGYNFKESGSANIDPFHPRFWEDRLGEPIEKATPKRPLKPKGIFVCDMSDLFGIGIPESWTEQVMTTIKLTPWNRYYLLTKQPQNLIKFSPFPDNCDVGFTATNTEMFVDGMDSIYKVKAKVKFLSFEPLLEWHIKPDVLLGNMTAQQLDWVIIGAQTKPYKPPKLEWVREIVEACDKAGISVFLKNNLWKMFPDGEIIPKWAQMERGKYRQEMPS